MKKGTFYMLEAAIAVLIMLTTLAVVLRQPPQDLGLEISNYKLKIYDALIVSEKIGSLREDSINGNVNNIKTSLENNVPTYVNFDIAVFNRTDNITSYPSIDSENVITVSYFISGYLGTYDPREIRVFIWGFD